MKLKDIGFVHVSVAFTTPKCDFSEVPGTFWKWEENRMEAVQNWC